MINKPLCSNHKNDEYQEHLAAPFPQPLNKATQCDGIVHIKKANWTRIVRLLRELFCGYFCSHFASDVPSVVQHATRVKQFLGTKRHFQAPSTPSNRLWGGSSLTIIGCTPSIEKSSQYGKICLQVLLCLCIK